MIFPTVDDDGALWGEFKMNRDPIFVAVELYQNLQDKWRAAGGDGGAYEEMQRALTVLKALPAKTMAEFAAKFRTLEGECMGDDALGILRQLRKDFDAAYVDTGCPLGMLSVFQDAVAHFPEDVWDTGGERFEVENLIWQAAYRCPPPKTDAGRGMLDTMDELYNDILQDDADAPEARRRIELMMNEKAWSADQRAQRARRRRERQARADVRAKKAA
jgi:hypothetical protein